MTMSLQFSKVEIGWFFSFWIFQVFLSHYKYDCRFLLVLAIPHSKVSVKYSVSNCQLTVMHTSFPLSTDPKALRLLMECDPEMGWILDLNNKMEERKKKLNPADNIYLDPG